MDDRDEQREAGVSLEPGVQSGTGESRSRKIQVAVAVGAAVLSVASAVASILGQEIQYQQMRAVESIAQHCLK